jgi:hypothetical protein
MWHLSHPTMGSASARQSLPSPQEQALLPTKTWHLAKHERVERTRTDDTDLLQSDQLQQASLSFAIFEREFLLESGKGWKTLETDPFPETTKGKEKPPSTNKILFIGLSALSPQHSTAAPDTHQRAQTRFQRDQCENRTPQPAVAR